MYNYLDYKDLILVLIFFQYNNYIKNYKISNFLRKNN